MKLRLTAVKNSIPICEATYEVTDGAGFGRACADIWVMLADQKLRRSANVGALYESISDSHLHDMDGVQIQIRKIG